MTGYVEILKHENLKCSSNDVQGAWDNYIANNTAMDSGNMWPMNLDFDTMGTPGGNQNQQSTANTAGNVFMGASTPAGGNVM